MKKAFDARIYGPDLTRSLVALLGWNEFKKQKEASIVMEMSGLTDTVACSLW